MANEFKIKKGLIVTGASGGTVVDIQGSQGQLFSVTDDLSGSIFAVSDISGVPILDVNSSGTVDVDGTLNINNKVVIQAGTTYAQATDYLYIGGNDLGSGDAAIYLGNRGDGTGYGWRFYYAGIGSGNNNNLVIRSENIGSPVDAVTFNPDGFATFAGDVLAPRFDIGTDSTSIIQETNRMKFTNSIANDAGGFDFYTRKTDSSYVNALQILGTGDSTFATQAFSAATSSGDASSTLTTKGYVDGLITGATIYRGAWDPSGGGYGSPDLSGVTQTSGYYYICSAAGTAEPNGTGTEPDTWDTGDWVIYNDVSGTGQWQKIDNSSVLSGVGTGQTVALWEGAGSVTDSETLGNAPITVSGNNTTFAGNVALTGDLKVTADAATADIVAQWADSNGNNTATFRTTTPGQIFEIRSQNSGTLKFDSTSSTFTGDLNLSAGKKLQYNANSFITPENNTSGAEISTAGTFIVKTGTTPTLGLTLDASQNATFAGRVTAVGFTSTSSNVYTGGMSSFETTLTDNEDWQNSPISILERGNVSATETADKYAPNLNFHWGGVVSKSLWMGYNGHLNWGEYSATGIPAGDGRINATFFGGELLGTINTATTGVTQTAGDNSTLIATTAYADAAAAAVPISNYLPLTGGTIDGQILISNTFPALDFVDTNSFTDVNDRFRVRAGQNQGLIQWYDDSSSSLLTLMTLNPNGDVIVPNGDVIVTNGNIGIGTTSPQEKLHVSGGVGIFNVSDAWQQSSLGTHLFRGGDFTTGIGNESSALKIFPATDTRAVGNYWGGINFMHLDPENSSWGASYTGSQFWIGGRIIDQPGQERSALVFATNSLTTAGTHPTERMAILPNGNVGIGTSNPVYKLDVSGSANNADIGIRINNTFDDNDAESEPNTVLFLNAASNNGYLRVHGAPANTAAKHQIDLGSTAGDSFLTFSPSGEKMRITNNGNVGIGTSDPAVRLDFGSATGKAFHLYTSGADYYGFNMLQHDSGPFSTNIFAGNGGDIKLRTASGTSTQSTRLTVKAGGNVGIGTISPGAKLDVNGGGIGNTSGDIINAAIFTGGRQRVYFQNKRTADGSDWNNNTFKILAKIDSTSHQSIDFVNDASYNEHIDIYTGNQVFNTRFNSNGNVGIGTTSPGYKLSVNGDIQIPQNEYIYFDNTAHYIRRGSSDVELQGFNGLNLRTNGSSRLYINQDGNVGIGTASPGAKLEITGSTPTAGDTTLHLKVPTGNIIAGVTEMGNILFSSSDASAGGTGSVAKISTIAADGTSAWVGAGRPTDLAFFTQPLGASATLVEAMRIDHTGNIGIGTSTPNAKLDVQGTQGQLFSVTDDLSGDIFSVADISGVPIMNVNSDGTSYFDGNVGIGTDSPWNIGAGYTGLTIDDTTTGFLALRTSGTNKLVLSANGNSYLNGGNVGIGTTSPSSKLYVANADTSQNQLALAVNQSDNSSAIATFYQAGIQTHSFTTTGTNSGILQIKSSGNNVVNISTSGDSYFNGGNVGIGATSPSKKLHLSSTANNGSDILQQTDGSRIILLEQKNGSIHWQLGTFGSTGGGANNRYSIKNATTGVEALVIHPTNNNVGIGITNPDTSLTVKTGSSAGLAKISSDGNGAVYSANGDLQFYTNDTAYSTNFYSANKGSVNVRILDNGKVGIGETNPTDKLHVGGSIKWEGVGTAGILSGSEIDVSIAAQGSVPLILSANNSESLLLDPDEYVYKLGDYTDDNNGAYLEIDDDGQLSTFYNSDLDIRGGIDAEDTISAGIDLQAGSRMQIDNVKEYRESFYTTGNSTLTFDVDIKNVGSSGQPFEVFAGWTHYSTGYGCMYKAAYFQRSTIQSNITLVQTLINQSSLNGGFWSVSYVDANTIRITKNAGSHAGGGHGYIRVTHL